MAGHEDSPIGNDRRSLSGVRQPRSPDDVLVRRPAEAVNGFSVDNEVAIRAGGLLPVSCGETGCGDSQKQRGERDESHVELIQLFKSKELLSEVCGQICSRYQDSVARLPTSALTAEAISLANVFKTRIERYVGNR